MARGRNYSREPVGATCPYIDEVIAFLGDNPEAIELMEKIRAMNGKLRDWGNEDANRVDELEGEISDKDKEINNLQRDIENLNDEIKELTN